MTRRMCDELPQKKTSICDLPADLVGQEILTRIPITYLRAVRSTCKLWDAISKDRLLGKADQFLGFMINGSKVCSVRFHKDKLDLSVKQVDLLDGVGISRVFHCDGLLLCVAKDHSRLVMWNPYLGQTQWIRFTTGFDTRDRYVLGYDINHNHKILRFLNYENLLIRYEIYEFSSNSWRVLKVTLPPRWVTKPSSSVSLNGNTYFCANRTHTDIDFLLCFDFTTERFGPRLHLPFHNDDYIYHDTVACALSCVKEEKLAVLYHRRANCGYSDIFQIWVTTKIEPNYVSWSHFLRVAMNPFSPPFTTPFVEDVVFGRYDSFFIDEEDKIAVVFGGYLRKNTRYLHNKNRDCHMAFVIGESGYLKSVSLGVAYNHNFCTLCSSSYLPSFVQLNQSHKGKKKGVFNSIFTPVYSVFCPGRESRGFRQI